MQLHESIEITPWFYLYFTENPGMAFGIEVIGKLFLSVFRIIAVGFIGYYLYKLVKQNYAFGFIACISLIFAGAIGNIIDSIFYGVVFDHSFGQVASFRSRPLPASRLFFPKEADMPVSCTARWLTCFISRSLAECTPVGCLGWAVNRSSFSVRSLTWPIRRFA